MSTHSRPLSTGNTSPAQTQIVPRDGGVAFELDDDHARLIGNFVRVGRGIRHGYRNISGAPVHMHVMFAPAGLESLFLKYRTDQPHVPAEGFVGEATRRFASEFGLAFP